MSAQGIAQIAVVMGSLHRRRRLCAGDVGRKSIIVRGQGTIFLGGPPLVKAATGEVVTAEELGGADVHSRTSGVTDHYAENDAHALGIARRIVANLNTVQAVAAWRCAPPRAAAPTTRRELYGVVPADWRKPYDVREVIARMVDGSEFDEFKRLYGQTLVTGFAASARLPGRHRRQQRHPVQRKRAEGRAFHRAVRPARHSAGVPAEHHRLHGRPQIRGRRHRQGRRQDGHRGGDGGGAEVHRDHRRQFRRRQLRHVRPSLFAALPVHVAERAHQRDGRRAGRQRAGPGAARRHGGARPDLAGGGGRGVQGADPRAVRNPGPSVLRQRPAVGRRRDRSGRYAARAGPRHLRQPECARSSRRGSACSGCDAAAHDFVAGSCEKSWMARLRGRVYISVRLGSRPRCIIVRSQRVCSRAGRGRSHRHGASISRSPAGARYHGCRRSR